MKHNVLAYHSVKEAIAAEVISFKSIKSEENLADFLNNALLPHNFCLLLRQMLIKWKDKNEFKEDKKSKKNV